ncbi:preprotein translocase subunit SecG [Pseudoduganella sp. GCM10020061]|jgi:preprotein translocase subunit SecG|uniref:preprotein translocase subunit SecG n=1 Tax=Pseudoduganella sp. GCM10020061 TaxID=3317345 RepID=UPI00362F35F9
MDTLFNLIVVVQVISALAIIGLVLLQHGKGADMGAAFGSGASGSLFGASGSSNFLSKLTAISAVVFFGATLALASMGGNRGAASTDGGGVMERAGQAVPTATVPAAPAATVPAAPAATVPAADATVPGAAAPAAAQAVPADVPAAPAPAPAR